MCEGTIVKTLKTKYFGNGSRVILKNKNEKWTEKSKMVRKDRTAQKEAHFSEPLTKFGVKFSSMQPPTDCMP